MIFVGKNLFLVVKWNALCIEEVCHNYVILIGCHGYFKGIDNCMQSYMAIRKSTAQPYPFKLKNCSENWL